MANPWSAQGWNLTQQMAFYKAHGHAAADALARAAGTTIGAKRPMGPNADGSIPIAPGSRFLKGAYVFTKVLIQGSGGSATPPPASVFSFAQSLANAIGVNMAAPLYLERDIAAPFAIGVNADPAIQPYIEMDLGAPFSIGLGMTPGGFTGMNVPATMALGVTMASPLYREADLSANFAIGANQTAPVSATLELDLAAAMAIGLTEAAPVVRELHMSAAMAIGLTEAAVIGINLPASFAIGLAESVAMNLTQTLPVTFALGLTEAAIVSANASVVVSDWGTTNMAAGSTETITISGSGIAAGSLIVVALYTTRASFGTMSDTATGGSNTYTQVSTTVAPAGNATTNGLCGIFYCWNCKALPSGKTITYNQGTTGTDCVMSIISATGIQTSSDPLDSAVTASNNGTGTVDTVTSGTPAQTGELFVGLCAAGIQGAATFTQASGWLTGPDFGADESTTLPLMGGHLVNAGLTAQTYAPTKSNAFKWGNLIVGFKHV